MDHPDYLLRLAELELIDRHQRRVERRIRAARFPAVKSLDTFDFLAIPSVNKEAAAALRAIRPAEQLLDRNARVFGLSSRQIGRRVQAAARAAGLGDGFTGHSGRVGMVQDLVKNGVELPALMAAGRWKSAKIPARYTER